MNKLPLLFLYVGIFFVAPTWAQSHKGITFQGVIKLHDNSYPTLSGVTVNTKVLSPTNCILREEEYTNVNISNGYITLVIGNGNRTGSDPNLTMPQTMNNAGTISSLVCLDNNGNPTGTTSYNPATGNGARKLRLRIAALDITADFNMRAIPFAINAETLNGRTDASFIRVSPNVTQTALEGLITNSAVQNIISGNYSSNNVTGTVAVANGGTGATSASAARTNLGLAAIASSGSASDLSTGTVPTARLGTGTANSTTYLRGDGTWHSLSAGGTVTSVSGKTGAVVMSLSDLKDKDGNDYFAAALECANGSALKYDSVEDKFTCVSIVINASAITAGTLPLSRGGTGGTDAASAKTSLGLAAIASSGSASDLGTGTVPMARLGSSGTANNTTYLRGDGTWTTITGGVSSVAGKTGAVALQLTDIKDKDGNAFFAPALECANGSTLKYDSVDDKFTCVSIVINASAITAGTLPLSRGGTGGTDAASAKTSLGLAAIASSGSASDLGTGTVPMARLGSSGTANNTTYLRGDGTWTSITGGVSSVNGQTGSVVLKPSHLRDGTGAVAALPTVQCTDGEALVYVSATDLFECQTVQISTSAITAGTLPLSRGGTGGTDAASAKTSLGLAAIASSGSASDLGTGTVPMARLGSSGTANNTTYLRGDGTWTPITGGVSSVAGKTGAVALQLTDIKDKNGTAFFAPALECANGSTLKYDSVDDKFTCSSIVINASAITAGTLPLARGGTGGTDAASAKTSLGLAAIASSGSASDLGAGTVPMARLGSSGTADGTTFLRGDGAWTSISNAVSSVNGLTGAVVLKPSHLRDGTGAVAALPTVQCGAGEALVYVSATDLFTCQTINIAAAGVTSGVLASARLGTGTADGTTFLRGDGTWAVPSVAGSNVTGTVAIANGGTGATSASAARTNLGLAAIAASGSAADLTAGTVPSARLGSGTADNTTYLRGDGAWTSLNAGHITSGVLAVGRGGTGASTSIAAFNALSPASTKGDMVIHDGSTAIRLGVGTNGQFVVADSSTGSGLRWRGLASTDLPTYTANRLIGTTSGGVLTPVTCAQDQVVSFNSSGNYVCANAGAGNVTNDGNSFGASMTLGTNDAYALNFETAGTTRMTLLSTGEIRLSNAIQAVDGSNTAPSYSFTSGANTGFYSTLYGEAIGVTAKGAHIMTFSNDYIESYRQYRMYEGNQGATDPGYSFIGDPDTGVYWIAANRLGFSTGGTGRVEVASTGILPITNGTGTVGTSSRRWQTGYFSGAIDTSSDLRLKKDIEETDLGLNFIMDLKPVSWHWKKGQGDEGRHYGFIAQEAEKTIQKHSAYPDKNLIVNHDEENDIYGIRYSELISPIIKAMQQMMARITGAEEKQQALIREVSSLKEDNAAAKEKLQKMEGAYQELLNRVEALEKK